MQLPRPQVSREPVRVVEPRFSDQYPRRLVGVDDPAPAPKDVVQRLPVPVGMLAVGVADLLQVRRAEPGDGEGGDMWIEAAE